MPIAKVRLPDGRIARFEVEEGTTPQEVEAYAQANIDSFGPPAPAPTGPSPTSDVAGSGGSPIPGQDPQMNMTTQPPVAQQQPTRTDEKMPWSDVWEGFDKNLIPGLAKSLMEGGSSALTAMSHPVDTAYNIAEATPGVLRGVKDITLGGLEKMLPGDAPDNAFDTAWQSEGNPFNSMESFKSTLANNPETFAEPLAALATGGAMAAPKVAKGLKGLGSVAKNLTKGTTRVIGDTAEGVAVGGLKQGVSQGIGSARYGGDTLNVIRNGMDKGVGMRPPGKHATNRSIAEGYKKMGDGIEEIVTRKNDLKLKDADGNIVTRVPETADEMGQAIEQTRNLIYKDIDNLKDKTMAFVDKDGKPLTMDFEQTATKLDKVLDSRPTRDFTPEVTKYAEKRQTTLRKGLEDGEPGYTASEVEDSIQKLNQSLEAYYSDKTPLNKGKAMVDALIADDMRFQLDSMIMKATGSSVAKLKKSYGALKSMESQVLKRSAQLSKKRPGFDLADIFAGHNVIAGMMTGSLPSIASGAAIKGMNIARKAMSNPNRQIKKMFRTIEQRQGRR